MRMICGAYCAKEFDDSLKDDGVERGVDRMDIEALKYAETLAHELHFGRSAQLHFIGEAQFGRRIKQLEQNIGVRIFDRTSRRVSVTPAGELVIAQVRNVLAELDNLRSTSRRSTGESISVGVLGFGVGARWRKIRALATSLASQAPLSYRPLSLADQYLMVQSGQVDVGLVHYLDEVPGLDLLPVMLTGRVAIVPIESHFARQSSLQVESLQSEKWLGFGGGDDRFLEWMGLPASQVLATPITVETMAAAVATTGLLGMHGAEAEHFYARPDVRFVPLDGAPVITALATRSSDDRPSVEAFRLAVRTLTCEAPAG